MSKEIKLVVNGKRNDGRGFTDLRKPFEVKAGVLKRAQGSAQVIWGRNKVVAGVYGPGEVFPKHLTNPHKSLINARYIMAPFFGLGRAREKRAEQAEPGNKQSHQARFRERGFSRAVSENHD
ncbi:MAG: hypothetical protein V1834_01865 [Candidatus Micrarchaeota archaeon]